MDRWKSYLLIILCATLLVAVTQLAGAQEKPSFEPIPTGDYKMDVAHSVIGFSIKHFGISNVRGRFKDFTGTIHYDAADVSKSTVEFTAKAESIDTGIVNRDNHLRSADFFDVAQFPELKFKSTKVEKKGKGYVLYGDFTIKGVTKQISFPFTIVGAMKDNRGNLRFGVGAETTIIRQDYGIKWGSALPSGINVLSNEVNIDLSFEAVKAAPPAATQQ